MSGCLKGVFRLSVAAFILLFVYFYFTDKEEIIVPEVKIENPSPEPGREVHSFDWDNMRYIYKDEVILSNRTKYLNSRPITNKFREDDEGTNEFTLDGKQVIIDKKRYRIHERPSGDLEFIPIR